MTDNNLYSMGNPDTIHIRTFGFIVKQVRDTQIYRLMYIVHIPAEAMG